ncbi:hypothetical protein IJJ18_03525 [Candidatus Saccharibacteria bacterium]|nr:hypothetical protein [Candidatus Saccharibacteria bacterium]
MLKVLVFDSGWGGDLIADYLEQELPIEVERLIDWRSGSYSEKTPGEIRLLSEMAILPHIGEADVIVLSEAATAAVALDFLKQRYPNQVFVGYGHDLAELVRRLSQAVMILTTEGVKRSEFYQHSKVNFSGKELVEPECLGWEDHIDNGDLPEEVVSRAVGDFRGTVVVYNPGFFEIIPKLEKIAGQRISIIDMKRALLRDVCLALKLRGVDGYAPDQRFAR